MKTLLVTLSLILAPTLTFADCTGDKSMIEASSCAEGAVWDAAKGVCLPKTTS